MQVIAVIVGIIASIINGIAKSIVNSLVACVSSTDINDVSGDATGTQLGNCFASYHLDNYDCICVQQSTSTCFFYSGPAPSESCNNVLTSWARNLTAGAAFDIISTLVVFAVSIITCVSLCCPASMGGSPPPAAQGQPVIINGQPAQPAVVVVQATPAVPYTSSPPYNAK